MSRFDYSERCLSGFCMDPVTMAIISVGASVIGGIQQSKAIGAQGAAQEAQVKAQAQADDYNRKVAERNALLTGQQTEVALEKQDRDRRLRAGTALANAGASGAGSFGDLLYSSAAQEELDLLTIQREGDLQAEQFTQKAGLLKASSQSRLGQIPLIKSATRAGQIGALASSASSSLTSFSSMKGK